MTMLARPRHPTVETALTLARRWCRGQRIDGAPALAHAARVAATLDAYLPAPPPQLIAAALLHDAPEFAPAADPDLDLYPYLAETVGAEAARVVRALEVEHSELGATPGPPVPLDDPWVLWASAADKVVALGSLLRRAEASGNPAGFWAARNAFAAIVPYLSRFHATAAPHLPGTMSTDLGRLVVVVSAAVCRRARDDRP
jgi:hypothetical protein